MRNIATVILLVIGSLWTLFTVWMLLAVSGVAGPAASPMRATLYWSCWFIGPIMLTTGAGLLLSRRVPKIAIGLVTTACVIFSAITVFNLLTELHRQPLQAPPAYGFLAFMVAVCAIADCAAYAVFRRTGKQRIF